MNNELNVEFVNKNCEFKECRIRFACIEEGRTCAAISNYHALKMVKK